MTTEKAEPSIKSVREILKEKKNLSIPDYQRPYKWQTKHVQQLIEDLCFHYKAKNEQKYRIGTVIVHNNGDKVDIVDGQQRITTLLLILKQIEPQNKELIDLEYKHRISYNNIIKNNEFIESFLNQLSDSKAELSKFANYILDRCEIVYIELNDLDEAFQFFDSQNSRGKSLEAYDLLKAYHLRAIPSNDPEILNYVEYWEKAASGRNEDKKDLGFIINLMLFKLRRWQKYRDGSVFTTDQLDTFKGINEEQYYPYLTPIKSAQALYQMSKQNPFMYREEYSKMPFSVSQTIINGRLFFKYIEYYRELYNELFNRKTGKLKNIKIGVKGEDYKEIDVLDLIHNYEKSNRIGDVFIRRLFQAVVLYYYDKFGNSDLDIAVKQILKWAYKFRIENYSIRVETIENAAKDQNGILHYIDQMIHSKEILSYYIPEPNEKTRLGEVEDIKCLFKEGDENGK
ncbi:hypothetical protein BKG92_10450 [Rodentibacter ratti]|uniref:Uncharacterized protein n=1 Tax=Rodentibacter ratti TaxID=1906745 RepID=A0A1V3KS97_9PAST|nr:DUF262 domain-containing protein [Rodentibacter ratti]OOF80491.1 hypothetical protein BKG92_10450 [Rodentibacter ratti]